jgi:hypothetical protein
LFDHAGDTFGPARPRAFGGTWWFAKYRSRSRAAKLRALFDGARLVDLAHKVLIASFDLDNRGETAPRTWKPKLFHNFPGQNTDGDRLTWEVAMATSAAPVLFPAFDRYVDGGVYSNNPSMCVLAQLFDQRYRPMRDPERGGRNPRLDEIVLLSIGSGLNPRFVPRPATGFGWGVIPWALPSIGNIVTLVTDGTVGIADYQCRQLLRENYHRVQPMLQGVEIELDSVTDLPRLRDALRDWHPTEKDVEFLTGQWTDRTGVAMLSNPAPTAQPTTAENIARAFKDKVEERVKNEGLKPPPRGAHPRHHGLVRAQFIVGDNVPADLRRGLLAVPRTYEAWVRFSNAGTEPHDGAGDARGIAIKVLNVPGEHLGPSGDGADRVQDFLLTNFPAFVASTPEGFLEFMGVRKAIHQAKAANSAELPALLDRLKKDFPNAVRAQTTIHNPLRIQYYSQTPYALGDPDFAVKYRARSVELEAEGPLSEEEKQNPRFLRAAMVTRLDAANQNPVIFEFQIQRRRAGMDIDDQTQPWSETESPFETVAQLVIPTQPLLPNELAEAISFNPWNSLKAHMPLGEINLARKTVYPASQSLRGALPANPAAAYPKP